ncbi:MAG: hypothetical protein IPJ69_14130 [Deltaproteobacteria bacterium]|nr:MAG: hypothetical protein IPJ69_14130 [Deltaproteobacteria bacterium]
MFSSIINQLGLPLTNLTSRLGEAVLQVARDVVDFVGVSESILEAVELLTGIDFGRQPETYSDSYTSQPTAAHILKTQNAGGITSTRSKVPTPVKALSGERSLAQEDVLRPLFCKLPDEASLPTQVDHALVGGASLASTGVQIPIFTQNSSQSNFPPSLEYLNLHFAGLYEVEKEIGQGGASKIYLARKTGTQLYQVIKIYNPLYRDLHEVEASIQSQPGFLRARGSGNLDGDLQYIVLDYAEKGTVADQVERIRQTSSSDEMRGLILDFSSSVTRCHQAGFIHGDVKPENFFPGHGMGDTGQAVKVGGFPKDIIGSPSYIPPESRYIVFKGVLFEFFENARTWAPKVVKEIPAMLLDSHRKLDMSFFEKDAEVSYLKADPRSDQYSLGKSIIEMLLGDEGIPTIDLSNPDSYEIALVESLNRACDRFGFQQSLTTILLKACSEDRRDRYDSVSTLHEELVNTLQVHESIENVVPESSGVFARDLEDSEAPEVTIDLSLVG